MSQENVEVVRRSSGGRYSKRSTTGDDPFARLFEQGYLCSQEGVKLIPPAGDTGAGSRS